MLSRPVNSHAHTTYTHPQETNRIFGVVIGEISTVADEQDDQKIFVNFSGNPYATPLLAMSTIKLNSLDSGKQVVLSFDQGNPLRPIIMGVLQNSEPSVEELAIDISSALGGEKLQAKLDGDQVTLTAEKEIVLQCGKSSITLTKAGKIIIRGEYLLSRSTGVNKIKGGSVQIN
ncbi:MAG: hypothetical protein AMJ53_09390 [Gammaproteobacteria bacterium SG8_11]|nr:MAG: hypothetical protein AMJ53_09390 [Gammaproteobacteria bacterium SG8_11]